MKICVLCGDTKPLEDFQKNKAKLDGRGESCASCRAAKASAYRLENKQRLKEYSDAYRSGCAVLIAAYKQKYGKAAFMKTSAKRAENKKAAAEKAARFYEQNKDGVDRYRDERRKAALLRIVD